MSKKLLAGIRVVDLSTNAAGPYAATLLALLGAEVIRVESATHMEMMRAGSRQGRFCDMHLNKLAITLDLKKPAAAGILKDLVKVSQVVVESFRPGVLEKFGLDYTALQAVKPDIIMGSFSGFGQTGPERNFASWAAIFAGMSGLASITGYEDGLPTEIRLSGDLRNGARFAFSILAAIFHWRRTGEGQYIDFSATEGLASLIGEAIIGYGMNNEVPHGQGNHDDYMAPHNCFRCKEDGWISIAVATDAEWVALCRAIGKPSIAIDERFADQLSRHRHQQELEQVIGEWTIDKTDYEVMAILQRAGVAAVPSFSSRELYGDPHLAARGYFVDVDLPEAGRWRLLNAPWKFSATPATIDRRGPLLGEHNAYVFGELLGISPERIAQLEREKIAY